MHHVENAAHASVGSRPDVGSNVKPKRRRAWSKRRIPSNSEFHVGASVNRSSANASVTIEK